LYIFCFVPTKVAMKPQKAEELAPETSEVPQETAASSSLGEETVVAEKSQETVEEK
jgi:hypothetical protein